MMQIVYFSQKDQLLKEVEFLEGEKVFVAPSPAKADGLRGQVNSIGKSDVITIAKFTSNLIEVLWNDEGKPALKRKAELLLIFGILKNKYLPALTYEQFTQAYNLFSDLRSFSLDLAPLTGVLEEQPESIRKAVQLFWNLLGLTGYLDEHGAYQMIAERLRAAEEVSELKKCYIFWGFQHLNGQQVDLLKALAIRYDVIIPFPLSLKDRLKKSDWVNWLKDNRTKERALPEMIISPQAQWMSINSREIARHLKGFITDRDQIILGISKLTPAHLDMIPSQKVSFKIPHQLLKTELMEIRDLLKDFKGTHQELTTFCLEAHKSARSMKFIRALQLYQEALQSISELTDDHLVIDSFFLKLLHDVVGLNQPRTSFVPLSQQSLTIDLKDMSSLEELDTSRRIIFCIDERFEEIQGLGQNYPETIHRNLAAIGPIKRNELEMLFREWEFRNLVSKGRDVWFLMNEGTMKHSLIWKRLLSNVELKKSEHRASAVERNLSDLLRAPCLKFKESFSASKLQTFIDCPRKFYFSFVEKIFPHLSLEQDFDPMTSGTIIHEIIEKFFKEKSNHEDIRELTRSVMEKHIQTKKLRLSRETYLQRELMFFHRTLNGLNLLQELERIGGFSVNWKIEESFSMEDHFPIKGRIDCLGETSHHLFLLDFKSTEFSASSTTEILDFEAVQLWVYALAAQSQLKDFDKKSIVLGYVVLDDPSKSNLIVSDEGLFEKIKSEKLCKVQIFKEDFSSLLLEAQKRLLTLTQVILDEGQFAPKPRKKNVCEYCDINKVCVKSELSHVT
jgi:CRISPR/Cas system-associated exonuclease Cas4 (RecB family)